MGKKKYDDIIIAKYDQKLRINIIEIMEKSSYIRIFISENKVEQKETFEGRY